MTNAFPWHQVHSTIKPFFMLAKFYEAIYAQSAKKLLLENFNRRITITGLALEIGISERTLKRAFNHTFHMGIHEYLVQVRMEKAAEYLADGTKSVKQVARMVGYSQQSSFTRRFTATFGISPSQYVSKTQGEQHRIENQIQY